ncbi:MAG TPA: hypothetical protein VHA73_14140 [Acidimicrobiales bacterium]|jgi:hypothetical protein|nr:hypothetical protein [Acidimicrobiales bacterium]
MTDEHEFPPASGRPPSDDDLLSDVLDDAATPAEVDQVMGDPALAARLEHYRAIRDAIAEPVEPLTEATANHVIDQALEEFDLQTAAVDDDADDSEGMATWTGELPVWSDHQGPGRPVSRKQRRATRPPAAARRHRRRIPPMAIAAALVLLAGAGLFLALTGRNSGKPSAQRNTSANSSTTSSAPSGATSNAMGKGAASSSAQLTSKYDNAGAAPSAGSASASPAAGFLGTFAGDDDLNQALTHLDPKTLLPAGTDRSLQQRAAGFVPSQAEINRCDPVVRGHIARALTSRLAVGGATSAGRNLLVMSYDAPATTSKPAAVLVIVASNTSCYPVLTQVH